MTTSICADQEEDITYYYPDSVLIGELDTLDYHEAGIDWEYLFQEQAALPYGFILVKMPDFMENLLNKELEQSFDVFPTLERKEYLKLFHIFPGPYISLSIKDTEINSDKDTWEAKIYMKIHF